MQIDVMQDLLSQFNTSRHKMHLQGRRTIIRSNKRCCSYIELNRMVMWQLVCSPTLSLLPFCSEAHMGFQFSVPNLSSFFFPFLFLLLFLFFSSFFLFFLFKYLVPMGKKFAYLGTWFRGRELGTPFYNCPPKRLLKWSVRKRVVSQAHTGAT